MMFTVGWRVAYIPVNNSLSITLASMGALLRWRHMACSPSCWGEYAMKKNEFSEFGSNLLIVGSVSLAFMPFLLGDHLVPFVTGLLKEGGVMIDQFSNYLVWLVS